MKPIRPTPKNSRNLSTTKIKTLQFVNPLTHRLRMQYPPHMKQLTTINHYPPQLVLDLALAVEDLDTILDRYHLTDEEYNQLQENPTFRAQLAATHKEVVTEGVSFKAKAKILAETHLHTLDAMMLAPETPPATKVTIFQTLMKGGELEPKQAQNQNTNQLGFSLTINI